MRFAKLHGAGNDFVVVDGPEPAERAAAERLARAMCERREGIGADGLIFLSPSRVADARFALFNADGSRAEVSGNGLRCAAKFLADRGRAQGDAVRLETDAGVREARVTRAGGRVAAASVEMGIPEFGEAAAEIRALDRTVRADLLSVGNPHAVVFLEEPLSGFPVERFGPAIERHARFPDRVNVHFARVLDRGSLELRSWERGVGETPSCGSGACAAAAAAIRRGLAAGEVLVRTRGGALRVSWDGRGPARLAGPAVEVFAGEWPAEGSAAGPGAVQ